MKVKLIKPHKFKPIGSVLELSDDEAPNLINNGMAVLIEEAEKAPTKKEIIPLEIKEGPKGDPEIKKKFDDWKKEAEPVIDKAIKEFKANQKEDAAINIYLEDERSLNELKKEVLLLLVDKKLDKATERITDAIKERFFIYTTREDFKSEIWIYNRGVYIPKGRSYIKEFTRKILEGAYTEVRANHVVAKIEADTFIEPEDFFSENNLEEIPVLNGVLNTRTKELSPFNPRKIFFNKIPVRYNPDSKCPAIDKFLSQILKNPTDKIVVYEIIGAGLRKEYTIEKAFMFVGSGRNGKGKLIELIKRFVGPENCAAIPLAAIKYDSSALCELHKRLFNLAGDLNNTDLKELGTFKQTVGRDQIQVKRKYLRDLIFKNYAKHIFAANELPKVYDNTPGFWNKWVLLEFPYFFGSEKEIDKNNPFHKLADPFVVDKISSPEELSGLLNKAIEGLNNILNQKEFSYTKGTSEIKDQWVRMSDGFKSFCLDKLDASQDKYITKEDLRKAYYEYCRKNKLKGAGDREIKATLQDLFGVSEKRTSIVDGSNDYREYVWFGVTWKVEVIKC